MSDGSHCIAGWCCRLSGIEPHQYQWSNIKVHATAELALTEHQAHELFSPLWDKQTPCTPKQAAKVLRHLAATDKVDWKVAGIATVEGFSISERPE
jgi:hypothetical protein